MIEQAEELPLERIEKVRRGARRYAARRGMARYEEDFAAFAVAECLERGIVNMEISWHRWKRLEFGHPDWVAPSANVAINEHWDETGDAVQLATQEPQGLSAGQLVGELKLDQETRIALMLACHWELSEREIAEVFGISESQVREILGRAKIAIQNRLELPAWVRAKTVSWKLEGDAVKQTLAEIIRRVKEKQDAPKGNE